MKFDIFNNTKEDWDNVTSVRNTLSIFNSYSWGEYKRNHGWSIIRVIDKFNKNIKIQLLVKNYLFFSIVWCPGIEIINDTKFKAQLQKAIKETLKIKIIYLRVRFITENKIEFYNKLVKNGWNKSLFSLSTNQTLIYDLSNYSDDIATNKLFSKNWKRNLIRSKNYKNNISVWKNPDANKIFKLYQDFEKYKKLSQQFTRDNIELIIKIFNKDLIIIKCEDDNGNLISIRGAILYKDSALDIFAVSSYQGKKQYSNYITFWKLFEVCSKNGISNYDLGGVDMINNKSVYNFKKGIGSTDFNSLGEFDWSNIIFFRAMVNFLIKIL
jgi:lipid II:glycine glycyltransferase (peptidoglycan interpeptide bridge formation enzyme)